MRQTDSALAASRAIRAVSLTALHLMALSSALPARAAEDPVALFRDTCAACHTVGGGELAGPDLESAASMDRATLRDNVVRMQDYAGELTDAQIDGLVDLLSDPNAAQRIGGADGTEQAAPAAAPEEPAGDRERGAALFTGRLGLTHGGLPCAACHRGPADGAASAGGTLAKSLAGVGDRLGVRGLAAAAENAAFPLMRGAYRDHPVTHEEALDLAAFLTAERGADRAVGSAPPADGEAARPLPVAAWAAGLTLVCLAGIGLGFRRRGLRPVGPRRRLLERLEARRTPGSPARARGGPAGAEEGTR